jgi:hypothetical protein
LRPLAGPAAVGKSTGVRAQFGPRPASSVSAPGAARKWTSSCQSPQARGDRGQGVTTGRRTRLERTWRLCGPRSQALPDGLSSSLRHGVSNSMASRCCRLKIFFRNFPDSPHTAARHSCRSRVKHSVANLRSCSSRARSRTRRSKSGIVRRGLNVCRSVPVEKRNPQRSRPGRSLR